MSLFASNRERKLWIWTLVVLVAIFSTLGLATKLAGVLAASRVGDAFFVLCLFLLMLTVATQGLRVMPGGAEIAVALGITTVYLLVFARMAIQTERSHLIEYGVVAVFILEALKERASHGRRVPVPWLLAFLATVLIGAIDECVQWFLPNRVLDPWDIGFNTLAAVMAIGSSLALSRVRRWGEKLLSSKKDPHD